MADIDDKSNKLGSNLPDSMHHPDTFIKNLPDIPRQEPLQVEHKADPSNSVPRRCFSLELKQTSYLSLYTLGFPITVFSLLTFIMYSIMIGFKSKLIEEETYTSLRVYYIEAEVLPALLIVGCLMGLFTCFVCFRTRIERDEVD